MKKYVKALIKSFPPLYFLLAHARERYRKYYYSRMREEQYPKALERWYKRKTGETLDLENPKTFNEKIQWLKLYDNTPLKTLLADKYKVRQWIAEKIGEEYLVPLLGVWENANDIKFDALPDRFVLKANHGSGWNIIVKDKNTLNVKEARARLNLWLKSNYAYHGGFSLEYRDIPPVIIAEEYIENTEDDLYDYKFYCFDGEPKYIWIAMNRSTSLRHALFDLNYEPQPFAINNYPMIDPLPEKPEKFDQMVACVKKLCEGFKHVRVDFYNVNGKIYFGEMTFYNLSGTVKITPPEYAKKLGDMIRL